MQPESVPRLRLPGTTMNAVATRSPLWTERAEAIDTVWLLMDPALFDRLITEHGWTPRRYGAWFADCALRLLTGP